MRYHAGDRVDRSVEARTSRMTLLLRRPGLVVRLSVVRVKVVSEVGDEYVVARVDEDVERTV